MIRMNHYGNNKRCKSNMAITHYHNDSMVLGLVDSILQEKMSKNYSTDDIGDSMVLGWKLVREIIEFFLFLSVMVLSLGVGFVVAGFISMVVFIMYLWDISKNFWKRIKKT